VHKLIPSSAGALGYSLLQDHLSICTALQFEICKPVLDMEELFQQWKEHIIVPIFKKISCSDYHGMSLLSTTYILLFNIILLRLTLCVDKIVGDHQHGF
jgi:hypothetical protein